MRAYLATSIGVACTAALVLPVSQPSDALAAPPVAAHSTTEPDIATAVPGSTESVPLTAIGSRRSHGTTSEQGVTRRQVRPFSLLGVVWDDADAEFHGTVQVRTRATATHDWSDWQDLETHNQEHGADPGTEERDSGTVHGSTAPLWVGGSDGVELRARATREDDEDGTAPAPLPQGLRLELIDPGEEPPGEETTDADRTDAGETDAGEAATGGKGSTGEDSTEESGTDEQGGFEGGGTEESGTGEDEQGGTTDADAPGPLAAYQRAALAPMSAAESESSSADEGLAALGAREIPALTKSASAARVTTAAAKKKTAPRPRIVTRRGWGANESLRERRFRYTGTVKAAFVHHSATGNNYTCKQAPSVLRGIYRYHVKSSGWRDFGYNFAIDKCGNIYEGRAGGVAKPVLGAHTLGFNTNTVGIAVLGTYSRTNPSTAATTAVARLTAWKLGLRGVNPKGKVTLTSGGSGKYAKGKRVRMNTISGHRDGFATDCPGSRLYKKLGTVRTKAARYQGR